MQKFTHNEGYPWLDRQMHSVNQDEYNNSRPESTPAMLLLLILGICAWSRYIWLLYLFPATLFTHSTGIKQEMALITGDNCNWVLKPCPLNSWLPMCHSSSHGFRIGDPNMKPFNYTTSSIQECTRDLLSGTLHLTSLPLLMVLYLASSDAHELSTCL
jgi:hypothetical protein